MADESGPGLEPVPAGSDLAAGPAPVHAGRGSAVGPAPVHAGWDLAAGPAPAHAGRDLAVGPVPVHAGLNLATDPGASWSPADVDPLPVLPLLPRSGRRFGRDRRRGEPPDAAADWQWVEDWRRGGESTPWGPGLAIAGFAGLIIGCAVYVITVGLADNLALAIGANVVVALGLSPALWMSRGLPVLRWIALGGAIGTVVAWISLLFFPHVS